MLDQFPGLRSLRAFDAAAKHLSFTRAASDMGVTPAAISHQIKELEELIGVSLFARTSRTMRLTREGEILRGAAVESLEALTRALQKIKKLENQKQLKVTASPSNAAKWLALKAAAQGVDTFILGLKDSLERWSHEIVGKAADDV